jgi:hypothetical protein
MIFMRRGFTIFFAMLIASLSLAVGLAIFDLTIRELDLSATATQSQFAIYAADTGADCALYWDFQYESGLYGSAFGTSTASSWPGSGSGLNCAGQDITENWVQQATSNAATTTFTVSIEAQGNFAPIQDYCAEVDVAKYTDGSNILYTTITSRGYNTCDPDGLVRVERALQVNY